MYIPSLTTVLSVAFLGYMANSMWNIVQLYIPPSCPPEDKTCISNMLTPTSSVSLLMFSTISRIIDGSPPSRPGPRLAMILSSSLAWM